MTDTKYFATLKDARKYANRQKALGYWCEVKKCIFGGKKPYFVEVTYSDCSHI